MRTTFMSIQTVIATNTEDWTLDAYVKPWDPGACRRW